MQCTLRDQRSRPFNADFHPCPICGPISSDSLNLLPIIWTLVGDVSKFLFYKFLNWKLGYMATFHNAFIPASDSIVISFLLEGQTKIKKQGKPINVLSKFWPQQTERHTDTDASLVWHGATFNLQSPVLL